MLRCRRGAELRHRRAVAGSGFPGDPAQIEVRRQRGAQQHARHGQRYPRAHFGFELRLLGIDRLRAQPAAWRLEAGLLRAQGRRLAAGRQFGRRGGGLPLGRFRRAPPGAASAVCGAARFTSLEGSSGFSAAAVGSPPAAGPSTWGSVPVPPITRRRLMWTCGGTSLTISSVPRFSTSSSCGSIWIVYSWPPSASGSQPTSMPTAAVAINKTSGHIWQTPGCGGTLVRSSCHPSRAAPRRSKMPASVACHKAKGPENTPADAGGFVLC